MTATAKTASDTVPGVTIAGVGKTYPGAAKPALLDVSLHIPPGEIFAFVGPSGSGKSTLLRIIAGLEDATEGSAVCVGPYGRAARPLYLFQDYSRSLLPWRTVLANVALPLEENVSRSQARELAYPYLRNVGLADVSERYPWQLSGGMQQRVAIARALAAKPDVLLLDEPFGALDALTRLDLQNLLLQVWAATSVTIVLVTHDVDEAVYLSHRVAVLASNPGRLARIYESGLSYPRDPIATREEPQFIAGRREVLETVLTVAGAKQP